MGPPITTASQRPSASLGSIRTTLLLAFALYSALAVLITFPLVLQLSTHLPKDLGDPLIATAILWWNAHVTPLTDQWWNGFGFFPAPGMMALSEHFLGASLIAAPLQWAGFSAITAYNLTFLASFPLCGVAAHALAYTLTRRHDAALVCGLAYAFNPYRIAHVEHLELLLAFGMPAALAALHLYVGSRRAIWLVAFAVSLILQALSSSYYALFFTVVFGLWILWFMRPGAWRETLAVVAAGGVAVLAVSPLILGYARIHRGYSMSRDFTEVLQFSGDLSSLVTASSLSVLWGWTAPLNGGERQLFPGLTIIALASAGVILLRRSRTSDRDRLAVASSVSWALSAALAGVAIGAWVGGPWRIEAGMLSISVTVPYKPLSLSVVFAVIAMALSRTARQAFRQRSPLAFYLAAASFLFLCSLGPRPAFLGEQILYEAPYAWLMRLPFFDDTVRVPARFAMPAVLALSVAAALAFSQLASQRRPRVALLLIVTVGIVADGWIGRLPLAAAPQGAYRIPPGAEAAAVLELPLGDVWRDAAALFRATFHRTPTVNGYNGYEPPYYQVLRRAFEDRDRTVLDALARMGPLVVAADNDVDSDRPWASFLSSQPGATRLSDDGHWTLFRLPSARTPAAPYHCESEPLTVTAAFDGDGEVDTAVLTDQNPVTWWITPHPQRAGDVLTLDLARVQPLCRLVLSMGSAAVLYPGTLSVATSADNVTWETHFVGAMGGSAFRAALASPRDARISVRLGGKAARFVRFRIEKSQPIYPWAVTEVVVEGQRTFSGG